MEPLRRRPFPAIARLLFAGLAADFAASEVVGDPAGFLRQRQAFKCSLPRTLRNSTLRSLQERNCKRVSKAIDDYQEVLAMNVPLMHDAQIAHWYNKSVRAQAICNTSHDMLNVRHYYEAADLAVNAWGTVLMEGTECCKYLEPPYCVTTSWTESTVLVVLLFLLPVVLLVGTMVWSFVLNGRREAAAPRREPAKDATPSARPVVPPRGIGAELAAELEQSWLRHSCLRVLDGAAIYARASASLFGALCETFDFQSDNARNQYEHLLSLWRSHVAMVADRMVEDNVDVSAGINEQGLLRDALGDLHSELLEGFLAWRERFFGEEEEEVLDAMPILAGATWANVEPAACGYDLDDARDACRQLAEVVTYLLVWGEAGNVRFMPEVVYFITELALAADRPGPLGLYSGKVSAGASSPDTPFRSGLFLAQVIRPIYEVVFTEWWQYVRVNDNGRDNRAIHKGFDAYLPQDVANYDDWDELFCDPARLRECLVLRGGEGLMSLSHGERFAALSTVDWSTSLDARQTKTHRELHSLWGVFATSHRVWLLHAVMFGLVVYYVTEHEHAYVRDVEDSTPLLYGESRGMRLAAGAFVVAAFGFAKTFALFHVTGRPIRIKCKLTILLDFMVWLVPVASYFLLRTSLNWPARAHHAMLLVHYAISIAGLFYLLICPAPSHMKLWSLTRVPLHTTVLRYLFWTVVLGMKFLFAVKVCSAMFYTIMDLNLVVPGRETVHEIQELCTTTAWIASVLEWFLLWVTTFWLFVADTQLWFVVGCAMLGTAIAAVQRNCNVFQCTSEDAVSKIPKRFSEKVLSYSYVEELQARAAAADDAEDTAAGEDDLDEEDESEFSSSFPAIWDRIVQHMAYEDKVGAGLKSNMSFFKDDAGTAVTWQRVLEPLRLKGNEDLAAEGASSTWSVFVPDVFRPQPICERAAKHYCFVPDVDWPSNADVQWRILALSRGLALPMPRPFRAPYIPGITVLIPHYMEDIILESKTLYQETNKEDEFEVPLINWLATRYKEDFMHFTSRQQLIGKWPHGGTQWSDYTGEQWEKLCGWSSMRMQTLYRTVAGMWLYYPALQALYEVQADRKSRLADPRIWDPADCFTLMVSMQMYKFFSKDFLRHTNTMFKKFDNPRRRDGQPRSFQVAFIDYEDKGPNHELDRVSADQVRRYFSCIIDASCEELEDCTRVPRLRIELPGYCILGDGKGDNQNHAIVFSRGAYIQCIDANQGAYFEQMLLLPNVLGEFRTKRDGDGRGKRIIGLPEHVTSDIGSIGDFAAGAERAFGTLLQRTYAVLGARMHYGHPDIMNKQYMMQQGGVSKATKTVNLSEDIFAGMDFTLRGEGRKIRHCEYMHLAKGRDLGFNTVLAFFSKLSSGAGEQVITRQFCRLGNLLDLPEALTFWYAHVGYYMNQYLISVGMPMLVFVWLLVLTSDCESNLVSFSPCFMHAHGLPHAVVFARVLSSFFSFLMLFFILATVAPLFAEVWYERSFKRACILILKQQLTLSPLLFVFQAKVIGFYVLNELRYGGATYVSTGRGLPTERRAFISLRDLDKGKFEGLYLDYAYISYYDGAKLLMFTTLVWLVGGAADAGNFAHGLVYMWISTGIVIVSWLFGPFIFNPYQFDFRRFGDDVRAWFRFFWDDMGDNWVKWWEKTQLKAGQTNRQFANFILDISLAIGFLYFAAWYTALNEKLQVLRSIFSRTIVVKGLTTFTLVPPVFSSVLYSLMIVFIERSLLGGSGGAESGTETDSEDSGVARCPKKLPLAISALVVTALAVVESWITVWPLMQLEWWNAFVAAMVLKWMLLHVTISLGENALRARCVRPRQDACLVQVCAHWVRSHRMFRDLLISSLILACLAPIVLLTALNDFFCPGCSWHQLLIYRDTGHRERQEAVVYDVKSRRARHASDMARVAPQGGPGALASAPLQSAAGSVLGSAMAFGQQARQVPLGVPPRQYSPLRPV